MAAAPFLVKEGEEQARQGNIKGAVDTFHQALKWNPNLTFNPDAKSQQLAEASALVKHGEDSVEQGNIADALAAFQKALQLDPTLDFQPKTKAASLLVTRGERLVNVEKQFKEAAPAYLEAQKLDPTLEISADSWNALCWYGSLQGSAKDVMFACENAVKLEPKNGGYRNSRGLARALTGNTKGAIADFQAYIAQTDDHKRKAERQSWSNALRTGKNPFTPEEIKRLTNE